MSCCHTDGFRAICCERERLWAGKVFFRPMSVRGILFYPDGRSRCYAPGLSLLCRGYWLLEIGFWAFYGCFLMNAIGRRFRPICYVFPAGAMLCSQAAKGVLVFCVHGVFPPRCPAGGVLPLAT